MGLRQRGQPKKLLSRPDLRAAISLCCVLGCTVAELGDRLSADEFGLWRAWLAEHQAAPEAQPALMAQLIAAVMNGPLTRADKQFFKATDFLPQPWPAPAPPPKRLTRREMAAALKASFKR